MAVSRESPPSVCGEIVSDALPGSEMRAIPFFPMSHRWPNLGSNAGWIRLAAILAQLGS